MAKDTQSLGRLGYRTNRGRETVEFWRSQLYAARQQWNETEAEREPIRTVISELGFPRWWVSRMPLWRPQDFGWTSPNEWRLPWRVPTRILELPHRSR